MSNGTETEEHEYPNIVERFKEVFQKLGIKRSDAYVDHCAKGDLEDLEDIEGKLYEMGLHPSLRNQVVNFWAAEIKQPVPKKLQKRLAEERGTKTRDEGRGEREPEKYSVDTETGSIRPALTTEKTAMTWDEAQQLSKNIKSELAEKEKKGGKKVTYVYDTESSQVRMAREGEIGGTLEQAKELKKMSGEDKGKGEEESPFIQDSEGNWDLNPKARITGIELMALDSLRRSHEKGEPADPIEALGKASEKMKIYREAFGGGEGKSPEWMSDPAKFIEMVRTISGEGTPDRGLKQQIAGLEKVVADMKEDKYREQIETQQNQIRALAQEIKGLGETVADLKRPVTGKTEMDIISEVATGGLEFVKTELPGMRRDLKEALAGNILPPPKTPGEKAAKVARVKGALQVDQEIEALGRKIFFGEH